MLHMVSLALGPAKPMPLDTRHLCGSGMTCHACGLSRAKQALRSGSVRRSARAAADAAQRPKAPRSRGARRRLRTNAS